MGLVPSDFRIDEDLVQSILEELGSSSRPCSQVRDKEGSCKQQEQEGGSSGDGGDDGYDNVERQHMGGERQHQDRGISSGIHHSESSAHVYNVNSEDGEDDENPRSAKRQRLPLVSPDTPANILPRHSPKPRLSSTRSLTPSSTMQLEREESPPEANHRRLPTPTDNEHRSTFPASGSPSGRITPFAEYREQPFQDFSKCITIGNQITYNVEFPLPYISERLNPSVHSEVLSASSKESSAEAIDSCQTITSRKFKELTKGQESSLAKMVRKDKTWKEIGKHFPGHTLQSLKENFFTKQGGKPRKRGRKPGVKGRGA